MYWLLFSVVAIDVIALVTVWSTVVNILVEVGSITSVVSRLVMLGPVFINVVCAWLVPAACVSLLAKLRINELSKT